ncbi:hypothetical protein H4J02_04300 [Protaetiibacter sp. SSC-01]|uniref:hypothetical protein n=1 Tax=Protaetiibacter sp. SSC-01 TaxID=2759943 RepID=UPI001656B348|nr:hypothetical protein [Protaetiibacter sp. SSC-01]QNO38254.1 hypothetical protein H4J02_04300 [Protaetiibacter sp. SSC-01]
MAQRRLILPALVRWRLTPWWGRVLVVFALSRVVTTAIMLWGAGEQARTTGASPLDYATFASNWDGQWYWLIAVAGYPSELPVDASGHVMQNAWAFMPAYPLLLGVFARLGFPFPPLAVLLSLAAGACAALLFERLLRGNGFSPGSALFGVVLLCTAPLSPMFQVAYAEAAGLALLFLALLLVQRRLFWTLVPVVILMSLTRPSGLAFALFLLLVFALRIWRRRRDADAHPLPPREFWGLVTAGLASFAAGLAWPAVAWAVTGSPSAYLDTELSWRASYLGYGELVPFEAWLRGIAFWLEFAGADAPATSLAVVAVVVMVALFAVFLGSPWGRRLGELRLWLVSYLVYLMAVFFPQSSTWRLLLPLSPALGAFAVPRSRALRVVLVVLGVLGQLWWVYFCWVRVPGDWSPP